MAMNITNAAMGDIKVISTTLGNLDQTLLAKLFNMTFNQLIIALNAWTNTHSVTIPSELFGIFTLSDMTLKYHDDYLEASLLPTF
jgi:hypothetical protein